MDFILFVHFAALLFFLSCSRRIAWRTLLRFSTKETQEGTRDHERAAAKKSFAREVLTQSHIASGQTALDGRGGTQSCGARSIDGVFDTAAAGAVIFHAATGLDAIAIAEVRAQVRRSLARAFVRRGPRWRNLATRRRARTRAASGRALPTAGME